MFFLPKNCFFRFTVPLLYLFVFSCTNQRKNQYQTYPQVPICHTYLYCDIKGYALIPTNSKLSSSFSNCLSQQLPRSLLAVQAVVFFWLLLLFFGFFLPGSSFPFDFYCFIPVFSFQAVVFLWLLLLFSSFCFSGSNFPLASTAFFQFFPSRQ